MPAAASLSQALAQRCIASRVGGGAAGRSALQAAVHAAFIDTAACILAGWDEPATRLVARWAAATGGGPAEPMQPLQWTAPSAALVQAVAGHALDFDDVGLGGHPSVVLVPTLWAAHAQQAVTGTAPAGHEVAAAYACGYAVWGELQRRVRVSLHTRGWHPTAVFGVVAAAAAVSRLRGLDAARTAHALGIAASLSAGVVANFGSMTKPFQVGRAALQGGEAVALAQAGLDASPDALDGPAGLLSALAGSPDLVDRSSPVPDDFDTLLLRTRPGIKQYPVCYAAHRTVDGVIDLARAHGVQYADVAAVQASLSRTTAAVLRHHEPATVTQARFSLEFCLAAALVRGRLGVADVSPAVLADPAVRALMGRVGIEVLDTSCPLEPSFALQDRVVLTLHDGRRLDSGPIRFARGHAQRPLDDQGLLDKLRACAPSAAQADAALRQIDALWSGPASGLPPPSPEPG
jgi:aconitate decarboxylase